MSKEELKTQIEKAAERLKPELDTTYRRFVTGLLAHLQEVYGKSLSGKDARGYGIYSNPSFQEIRRSVWQGEEGEKEFRPAERDNIPYRIHPAKLSQNAEAYAEHVSKQWIGKLTAKIVDLENAKFEYQSGGNFKITGERDGRKVEVLQQTVFKVSPRGIPFNQFPALIHVDGKFYPEAVYQKVFLGITSEGLCIKSPYSQALLEQLPLLYQKSRMSVQAPTRRLSL